jgi:hydrogenase expression/formation protein HypC
MCLGIPGQVMEMSNTDEHLARVDVPGVVRVVNIGCWRTKISSPATGS